jgi:hypothetical protein
MSAAQAESDMIHSAIAGGRPDPERLTVLLEQPDYDFPMLLAALRGAARRRFADLSDLREVTRWIGATSAAWDVEGRVRRLPPREAEAVIRAVMGEPHLLAAVEPSVGIRVWPILRALLRDVAESPAHAQALLAQAERDARTIAAGEPELVAAWGEICRESSEFWLAPSAEPALVASEGC